jgi:hypothetical protein
VSAGCALNLVCGCVVCRSLFHRNGTLGHFDFALIPSFQKGLNACG